MQGHYKRIRVSHPVQKSTAVFLADVQSQLAYHNCFSCPCKSYNKANSVSSTLPAWGLFLERPRKLSYPVSHLVRPRKLFGFLSKLPLFSIPLIFPVTWLVIHGRSWPPVKWPGSHKCCKTKQNAGRRWTFLFSVKTTVMSKMPLSSRYGWLWSHWRYPLSRARKKWLVEELKD